MIVSDNFDKSFDREKKVEHFQRNGSNITTKLKTDLIHIMQIDVVNSYIKIV